jgi:hypothetical protein
MPGEQVEPESSNWLKTLGIRDRESARSKAAEAREAILEPARQVLAVQRNITPTVIVFQGFIARARALHESSLDAIEAGNPVAAFTLLRAHAENAAGVLYAKDNPQRLGSFWGAPGTHSVKIGVITNHAKSRFAGFSGLYSQLSEFAHPGVKGIVVSSKMTDEQTLSWQSAPRFRRERDALTAFGWLVELGEASHHLLFEFAEAHRLGPWQPAEGDAGTQQMT